MIFRVTGRRGYREYQPGATFEAAHDESIGRALAMGAITVIDRTTPAIDPGRFTPPDGWPNHEQEEKH